jgi:hypothetical protein
MSENSFMNKPCPQFVMKLRNKKVWKPIVGAIAGGLLGFAYYYFVGCKSGTCPITSNPYISILFGAVMGLLLLLDTSKKKE